MSRVDLILAFALGAEVPIILACIYFLKRKTKQTNPVVESPFIIPVPLTVAAPTQLAHAAAVAPTSQVVTVNATKPIVKCATCGHFVARYTQTSKGPVCANELPIV